MCRRRRAACACTGARCSVFSRSTRRRTDRRTQPGFLGARGVLRGGSRPAVTREGGAEPLRSLLAGNLLRSEEHTSELQSLMRISYAVFCLKKKKKTHVTRP